MPLNGIFKIETVTKTDKFGNTVTVTSIKLGDVIKAIRELNKMEGIYRQRSRAKTADCGKKENRLFK